MSIEIECPSCHRRMRAPDTAVGKKVKCPKCQTAIAVVEPDEEETYTLKIEEGDEFGPVSKKELDDWFEDGRITEECQILRSASDQWQWAADLYPDLEEEDDEEPQAETHEAPPEPPAIEPPEQPPIEPSAPSTPVAGETAELPDVATDPQVETSEIDEAPVEDVAPQPSTPEVQEVPAPATPLAAPSRLTIWMLALLVANLFFTLMCFIFLLISQFRS